MLARDFKCKEMRDNNEREETLKEEKKNVCSVVFRVYYRKNVEQEYQKEKKQ